MGTRPFVRDLFLCGGTKSAVPHPVGSVVLGDPKGQKNALGKAVAGGYRGAVTRIAVQLILIIMCPSLEEP